MSKLFRVSGTNIWMGRLFLTAKMGTIGPMGRGESRNTVRATGLASGRHATLLVQNKKFSRQELSQSAIPAREFKARDVNIPKPFRA